MQGCLPVQAWGRTEKKVKAAATRQVRTLSAGPPCCTWAWSASPSTSARLSARACARRLRFDAPWRSPVSVEPGWWGGVGLAVGLAPTLPHHPPGGEQPSVATPKRCVAVTQTCPPTLPPRPHPLHMITLAPRAACHRFFQRGRGGRRRAGEAGVVVARGAAARAAEERLAGGWAAAARVGARPVAARGWQQGWQWQRRRRRRRRR